jgi:hypothetical protein
MKCDLCTYQGESVKPYEYQEYAKGNKTLTTHLCNHHALYWGYLREGE